MNRFLAILTLVAAAATPPCAAQEQQPPADTKPQEPPKGDAIPDLDELLGVTGEGDKTGPKTGAEELQRKLNAQEAADALHDAVRMMGDTAARIQGAGDIGIATQRAQEDIVRKLDQVIASAKKQRNRSSSQSPPSQSQDRQNQPSQRQSTSDTRSGDNREEMMPPSRRDGELGPDAAGGSEWGRLPPRVRDALSQGSGDRFSALYKAMTEAYYRRLAEENRNR